MRYTTISVFLLILTALTPSTCRAQSVTSRSAEASRTSRSVSEAARKDQRGSTERMLPGIVTASQKVSLSVPMNGVLDRVLVNEGDAVVAGQVVAGLDDRVARASLRLAEVQASQDAVIVQARQHLEHAQRFLNRVRGAHSEQAASEHELDEAQSKVDIASQALRQAEERQEQAKAQLQLDQARLALHQIVAPFDGTVSRIAAHGGESMSPGDPLLQIVNVRQLKVELHIPAQFFGKLVRGESYALDAGAPVSRQIKGQLQASENMIDAATNTFRCVFLIENQDESQPAGFVVRLASPTSEVPPRTALRTR